jgi:hypothetical protein
MRDGGFLPTHHGRFQFVDDIKDDRADRIRAGCRLLASAEEPAEEGHSVIGEFGSDEEMNGPKRQELA